MSASISDKIQINYEEYTVQQSEEIEFTKREIQKLNEQQEKLWFELLAKLGISDEKSRLFDYVFNDFNLQNSDQ